MAFKRIEKKESLKNVPMLSEFIEKLNPKELKKFDGTVHLITSIVIAKSGKGYMLNFASFCTFIFNKSNEADELRRYFDDNRIGIPCIEIDFSEKYNFNFGLDEDIDSTCYWKTESIGEVTQNVKECSIPLDKPF